MPEVALETTTQRKTSDLEFAFATLTAKTALYSRLWDYYDGNQPLVYAAERLRDVFQSRESRFSENWCAVVVDAELDRIHLNEFTVANNTAASDVLNTAFEDTELNLDAEDVHKAALVCGESYVFVWKDTDDGEIEAYYHDPRLCHVFYEQDRPRKKRFAVKWWVGEQDGLRYLNLYYPERIEYYASKQKAASITNAKALTLLRTEENPFEEIPVFHFKIDRRKITSRLQNVIEPQDALNKLLADMMVSAEFGAFNQRYVITSGNTDALKNAPNEIWQIPAGDGTEQGTQVGQFEASNLGNYLNAIDKLATSIAIISRTPKHYVFQQTGDPSGEALIAMEAPLNKKAQRAIDIFKPTWKELAQFILKLSGINTSGLAIAANFDAPETIQPRTQAEIREINVRTGIPLVTTLRDEGWTEDELAQLAKDKAVSDAVQNADTEADGASDKLAADIWTRLGLPSQTPTSSNPQTVAA